MGTTSLTSFLAGCARYAGWYKEGPNNDTIFGLWYGMNHQPYCAMGLSYVAAGLGASDTIGKFAYCPSWVNWFRARDQWVTSNPRPGDIVFYQWSLNGVADHVGVVEKVNADGTIQTIEFNTSSGAAGSQSNGDGCYRRTRNTRYVLGYGRPTYATAGVSPAAPPSTAAPAAGSTSLNGKEIDMIIMKQKERGIWLVGPGYANHVNPTQARATLRDWDPRLPKGADLPYPVVQYEDGPVGQTRFDQALAMHTQNNRK